MSTITELGSLALSGTKKGKISISNVKNWTINTVYE